MLRSRTTFLALAFTTATTQVACYGKFGLVRAVYDLNGRVTDNKFVHSLLNWVLIPVYGIAGFADFVILNPIEFWTGNNPMASNDPAAPSARTLADGSLETTYEGHVYIHRQLPDGRIEVLRDGAVVVRYRQHGDSARVEDASGRLIGDVVVGQGVRYAAATPACVL